MPKQSNNTIITNRQLNFTLSPVDLYNPKEMPYSLPVYQIDGTWNNHQSILLDAVLDRIFKGVYRENLKYIRSWRSKIVIGIVSNYLGGIINPATISFLSMSPRDSYIEKQGWDVIGGLKRKYEDLQRETKSDINLEDFIEQDFKYNSDFQEFIANMTKEDHDLRKDFPIKLNFLEMLDKYSFLENYRYSFKKHLKKISETKFRMNYKIKYVEQKPNYNDSGKMIGRGKMVDIHYTMNDYQNLFDVDIDKKEISLNFNTPLGKFIIHNTLLLDTDWCPYEALSLSNNAYFLFKRFVMNKRMGKYKAKEIPLEFEDIKRFLDLNASLERHDNKIIVDSLNDMVQSGLMKSFNAIKRAGKRRYVLLFEED